MSDEIESGETEKTCEKWKRYKLHGKSKNEYDISYWFSYGISPLGKYEKRL